jgi:RNase P/RNase MRP subunit p29
VKRSFRLLLIMAPLIVLLLGVPAGVALARRSPASAPITVAPGAVGTAIANGTARPRPGNGPFIGPQRLLGPPLPASQARTGVNGTITRVTANRIVVYTRAKKVAVITIDPTTILRFQGKNVTASELMPGDNVTVLGRRDSARVFHAEAIRITRPAPPNPPPGAAR